MILRWLRSRRERRRRQIFRFHDGDQYRTIDPVMVAIRLGNDPDYLPRHLDEALTGDPEAIAICVAAVGRAFGVRPLDEQGRGMPASDQVALLRSYEIWVAALKKNMMFSVV